MLALKIHKHANKHKHVQTNKQSVVLGLNAFKAPQMSAVTSFSHLSLICCRQALTKAYFLLDAKSVGIYNKSDFNTFDME